MNCQQFWSGMPELARQLNAGAQAHLEQCASCAALFRNQQRLTESIRILGSETRMTTAPGRLESRLLAAYREYNGTPARSGRRTWIPILTWAAAAAAMVVLGVFLVRGRQPAPVRMASPHPVQIAMLQGNFGAESGFIPLPNAQALAPNEEGDLVRLELPRSAMLAVGLPVSADRASEPVEADVILGPDGLARAVRFLDE